MSRAIGKRLLQSVHRTRHFVPARSYNFASSRFRSAFGGLPIADGVKLRENTIKYIENFDEKLWYDEPATSILNGKLLTAGETQKTVDAFNFENGSIRHATEEEVDLLIQQIKNFKPERDYRESVRKVEVDIFENYSDFLIGNQALDFHKQDGVTEIEESVQANLVERRMNDQLLEDEAAGVVTINRATAFCACVSNFTNFLDLSRKTLRNIELGVPVVVLSRSNTTQHMYRWAELLTRLMAKHGVEPGMVSYAACSLAQQRRLYEASPTGAIYLTSNREVAETVRNLHGNVMASTGGPNTLVAPGMTQEVGDAVKLSAMIENSGQCTALRHACIAGATEEDVAEVFQDAPTVGRVQDALKAGTFAGIFDKSFTPAPFELLDGYTTHPKFDNIALRFGGSQLPPDGIKEQWRQTYVDVAAPTKEEFGSEKQINELAGWLVRNQPITLAMNTVNGDMGYARKLFERTSQVVYTVGFEGSVAYTCQARPQEGEIFGEFPVRRDLAKYTRYPVTVPSPTPAYNSHYQAQFLQTKAKAPAPALQPLLQHVQSSSVRGYCVLLMEYLADACGAHRGNGKNTGGPDRTILYGLQRPPLNGQASVLRCNATTTFDELAPTMAPFFLTNALGAVRISVDPANARLLQQLTDIQDLQGCVVQESSEAFDSMCATEALYNVVQPEALADNNNTTSLEEFPMVAQFVSLYFPFGHIKSTRHDDEEFASYFSDSEKWLKMRV